MIGLGTNRLSASRLAGLGEVCQLRNGQWLEDGPYSSAARSALKAAFSAAQWATIRDYGFAHPWVVPYVNAEPIFWGYALAYYSNNVTILKNGYQMVEYIEKVTGTTIWVNTGIKPKEGDIMEVECEVAWNSRNGSFESVIIGVAETTSYVGYTIAYGSTALIVFGFNTGVSLADHNFHKIIANTADGTYVDGVLYPHEQKASPRTYTNQQQMFNKYSNGYEVEHFFGKQKKLLAKINGEPVGMFVPCYNKQSNLVGMFNIVEGAMASTGGSGAFVKGQDI